MYVHICVEKLMKIQQTTCPQLVVDCHWPLISCHKVSQEFFNENPTAKVEEQNFSKSGESDQEL